VGFFFSSRRRHTRFSRDWSSDVCSSDLQRIDEGGDGAVAAPSQQLRLAFVLDLDFDLELTALGLVGLAGDLVTHQLPGPAGGERSEERRVGKECRCRWAIIR